jgi:hypothetical protein
MNGLVRKGSPLRRILIGGGVVIAIVSVLFLLEKATDVPNLPTDTDAVAREWNSTIGRLGIEPVYPPQEDVTVGDIFLVVTGDNSGNISEALPGRALKVWHTDLTKELEDTYKGVYSFPDTQVKPKTPEEVWEQKLGVDSIFARQTERRSLPLVLLPGFTVARIKQASVGGGWISRGLQAVGAIEREGRRTVELKIPMAETYGIPSLLATAHLSLFCQDPRTRAVCTESGARRHLSTVVGSRIFERVPDPVRQGKTRYRLMVEICLLNRVYLTRSIETVSNTGSSTGGRAKLNAQLTDALQRLEGSFNKASDENAAQRPESVDAIRRALDDQKARLKALIAEASSASGGNVAFSSVDESGVALTQNLQRPVAIGFRAVRRDLYDE